MGSYKETILPAIFQNRAETYGERACVGYKKDGSYIDISWNEMNSMIHDLGYYLLSLGVKKGDRVGIFSPNRYEWWISDQAVLSIGACDVPVYPTSTVAEAEYILSNSGATVCIVGTEDHLERVLKAKKKLPNLKKIIILDDLDKKKKDVISLEKALLEGQKYKSKPTFEKRLKAIKESDLATIMYTSGTTGNPKGVMLTHSNFVSNVVNIGKDISQYLGDTDTMLSFLPLSHVLERTTGYYLSVYIGATVYFAVDMTTLMENFVEIRPTAIISVPRIYEKLHAGILSKTADAPAIKKMIFNFAIKSAVKNLPYVCTDTEPTGLLGKRIHIADKLVFSKIKETLGLDKLKYAISGGGPLSISDAEFFIGMGVRILEGFGLTETTPVTNYNRPGEIKPGTVGRAIPETDVKISDEGEILIKGPQVMKGYYKNKKATDEAFTKDGYFRTGDIGVIDEMGRLSITGRIKDIIVTAGGKNISPQNIENSVKTSAYVEQIAIIGDKRKYLSALIVPTFEELKKWAEKNSVDFTDNDSLIQNEQVIKLIGEEIEKYTKQFARVEQIRKFKLLNAEWSIETEELTPSLKIKRRVVEKKYAKDIEEMYPPE